MGPSEEPGAEEEICHKQEDEQMSDLIAIGYEQETTASEAAKKVMRLSSVLIVQPDAVATIVRDANGDYHVKTNHHFVGGGATWGMFWGLLFGLLFFVPVFGLAIGAGLGALFAKIEKTGIDRRFQEQVREMIEPGNSALFLIVEKVAPERAVGALAEFGGTVLASPLANEAKHELQQELHGTGALAA
jgi:uncharacterized membrane protein